jgi:hypothetical protein
VRWVALVCSSLVCSSLVGALLLSSACDDGLDAQRCHQLRSRAFDLLNRPHACAQDEDCQTSAWPGCPKAINKRDQALVDDIEAEYNAGRCAEPVPECPTSPTVACDRNLCVMRFTPTGAKPH